MVFNVVARDQDDHVKNIAFLMDRTGTWSLSPAFDVCYSYNPAGDWTATHQMTINGKRDRFTRADFAACAQVGFLKKTLADTITDEVCAAVVRWPEFALAAKVSGETTAAIARAHRLQIPAG
jgi:serine/threonine-protein kinase HipA